MSEAAKEDRFAALWRELEAVPEGYFAEIAGGEVRVLPRPGPRHARAASRLGGALDRLEDDERGGWVILDEPDVKLGDDVRTPDLAGWRTERYVEPEHGPYTIVPDWICEVLSPSTARIDRAEKMPLYARHGVGHLWLIDPVAQTLEVYRRQHDLWIVVAVPSGGQKVRAEPFESLELDLSRLWHVPGQPPE
ncbi:MAG: Uma2 family endonuclease [Sandaracinaceae bacterium]|nr:Uma2 family endonuclease [Sandaracinaceae bacterium]